MSVVHVLSNGEQVPVPVEVVAEGRAAEQSFYDNQELRLKAEAASSAAPAVETPAAAAPVSAPTAGGSNA